MVKLLLTIGGTFFKIGLFTLGGGIAIIPLVQQEMVTRGWLTNAQFTDILGIAQVTPGPLGVNTATFVGYRVTSLQGLGILSSLVVSLVATLAVTLPSVIGVAFGGFWFEKNRDRPVVIRVFTILRPLVSGLVAGAGLGLALDVFGVPSIYSLGKIAFDPVALIVLAVTVWITMGRKFSPLWGLLLGAVVGLVKFLL